MFSTPYFEISYFTTIQIKLMLVSGTINNLCFLFTFINKLKYFNVTRLPLFTPISLTDTGLKRKTDFYILVSVWWGICGGNEHLIRSTIGSPGKINTHSVKVVQIINKTEQIWASLNKSEQVWASLSKSEQDWARPVTRAAQDLSLC